MKIAHWSLLNGSGMHRVAESLVTAEKALGLDSILVNSYDEKAGDGWSPSYDADVHVIHTHLHDKAKRSFTKPLKQVWVGHGTPDHVFQSAVEAGANGYGHADHLQLMQYWLKNADARVTFWPRHQWIYEMMVPKSSKIDCVPLGVDLAFWKAGASRGKFQGTPSLFTAENAHYIKWPYDLFTLWPAVYPHFDDAFLHAWYLPRDMHRWFFPLINANGTAYRTHVTPASQSHDDLRNTFHAVDFTIGLVRYGDFNQFSLQANAAAGSKTISYAGNPYADYWITEGDQRVMAAELVQILKGEIAPREKSPVPDISETAGAMKGIYEGVV